MYYGVFSSFEMYYNVLRCIEIKGPDTWLEPIYEAVFDVSIHAARTCWMYTTSLRAIYMQKVIYSSLLGCFAVFKKRGEQCGCILDVLACILHVLAVLRCIDIEYIEIHPNCRALQVWMYWRDLYVLCLYWGCIKCIWCIPVYLACIVPVY